MVTLGDLIETVEARYAAMNPPQWPDPHDGERSAPEEYERLCSGRCTVLAHRRIIAWLQALVDLGVARVQDAHGRDVPLLLGDGLHAVAVRAARPGTLTLWVITGAQHCSRLAVVDPQLEVYLVPSCGCDAGSDQLIDEIDDTMEAVVGGTLTVTQDQHQRLVYRHRFSTAGGKHDLQAPVTGH